MKKLLGKIVKPQGIKGELKVYPADSDLSIYKNIDSVFVENEQVKTKVLSFVKRQGFLYLKLEGVVDRDRAEQFRNKKLYVDEEQLSLNEGTYFTDDLIDLDVVDENGNYIGVIVDIDSYGSADVITILEDKREYSIPFLTSIVLSVNKDCVVVDSVKYNEVKIWKLIF